MKPGKYSKKIIASALATSILQNSCTSSSDNTNDAIYEKYKYSDEDLGKIAIPITVHINSKDAKYISFLQKLSSDIIRYPFIAKEFSKNPSLFVKRYGYDEKINLDDGMMKLIIALGDEDINNAIKTNDIRSFYYLCKEKNYYIKKQEILI